MAKWKYKVEGKDTASDFSRGSIKEEEYLNSMWNQDWELVSVVANAPTMNYDKSFYYWKKEVK